MIILILGFMILGALSFNVYRDAPPIPFRVLGPSGEIVFTKEDLNVGLALMAILNLFPGGVFQLLDVLKNGYWHARSVYMDEPRAILIEWLRFPADLIFIFGGVVPLMMALLLTYNFVRKFRRSQG